MHHKQVGAGTPARAERRPGGRAEPAPGQGAPRTRSAARALAAALGIGAVLAGCGSKSGAPAELTVASFAPDGASHDPAPVIQLQFDAPVVPEDQVGVQLEDPPLALEPAARLDAHWLDRQTLVAMPDEELKPSTRYQVSLRGSLASRAGGFGFSFVQLPLVLYSVTGAPLSRLPPTPQLALQFNQKVVAGDVTERCRIRAPASEDAISLATGDAALQERAIVVSPSTPLAQGSAYELVCEGLTGAGGDAPLAEPFVEALHTYPTFNLTSITPEGDAVPPDELSIELSFNNPVDLDSLRAHLSMEPEQPGVRNGWMDSDGTRYRVNLNLETTTRYTLRVAEGLKDIYGQALPGAVEHSFTTSDAQPRISMETGIYALESSAAGYPVWTRNVGTYEVTCARVPKQRASSVLTTRIDYGGWSDGDEDLDWKQLGLQRKDETITVGEVKNKWHLAKLDLGALCGAGSGRRGVYLVQLRSDDIVPDPHRTWAYRPYQRVLANVTDLGVLLKVGDGSGLVWVTRLSDGEPVPGARVTLYTHEGKRTFTGNTGADGILRVPGRSKVLPRPARDDGEEHGYGYFGYFGYSSHAGERVIAVVETGDDMALVDGNWSDGIQAWNFGVSRERGAGDVRVRGFIQSDRGIYRPGETVHFKGLVREVAVGRPPAVPRKRRIAVKVESSRGATVLEQDLTLSEFGGFHFDLPLEPEAQLGDYHVKASFGEQTFRERFSVEEFRKVAFEIDVKAPGRHSRLGETIHVDVSADYLFGEPVSGAQVEWRVERRRHRVRVPAYAGFAFADYAAEGNRYWWYRYRDDEYAYLARGQGVADKRGKLRIDISDPDRDIDTPQDYLVHVTVKDATDQAVQKSAVVTGHKSDFYLGLRAAEYVQPVSEPIAIEAVAVTPTGEAVAAKATLSAIRRTHACTYTSVGHRSYPRCENEELLVASREISIPSSGPSTERVRVEQPGSYILRLEGTDSRGNRIASSTHLWVSGAGGSGWEDSDNPRFDLIASKASYEPGETARLVPQSSLDGATALVTVERDGIIDARVQRMGSAGQGLELALSRIHAPNVFASVAMVRGRTGQGDQRRPRFQMGMTELQVSSEPQRLQVDIATDGDTYEPGQPVRGTLRVTSDGAPVRAEVSLSVADEGVLQLIDYKTPDPMKSFYATWGLGVDSATSWTRIARLDDPSEVDPEYGAGIGETDDGGRVRSRFVSSAYWAPALVTGDDGAVAFEFQSPDNLTAFRLMAVAADSGARFGSGERRITVKKPLLAKPVLPRFFTAGDRGEIGVVVHNYTGADGTVQVTARAEGLRLGEDSGSVKVAAGDSARVGFPVRVGSRKEVQVELTATMGAHSDALRMSVPVNRPYVYERKVLARGELGAGEATRLELPLRWDGELIARDTMVTVSVDRTGMGELEQSLRYLIEYPYGCLEQTLSRFIPLTKVKDLARSLNIEELEGTELERFVRAGAAKVARHQDRSDGHFSLWPGSGTHPHLTVYALYGLNEARRAGVRVDQQTVSRGLEAMRGWARSAERKLGPGSESATVAMAAYLMADLGQPDNGLNARLFEAHRALPRYGQAFLLRALHLARAPDAQTQTVKQALVAGAEIDGDTAVIREPQADPYYMDSDVRTTAIALSALLAAEPGHELVPRLAEGLMRARRGGRWANTQENLYALVALADYARLQEKGTALVTLYKGKEREIRRRLDGHETLVFRRSARNLGAGPLVIEAEGKVRYLVRVDEAREAAHDAPLAQGFAITREYLDPTTKRPLTRFPAGALVHVKLTVESTENQHYVAVVDPLPAGLEAVNTRLATVTDQVQRGSGWQSHHWSYHELRDDEVRVFADRMRPGKHTFEYLARATLPGEFLALPARAEAMYDPERNGRSTSTKVTVRR